MAIKKYFTHELSDLHDQVVARTQKNAMKPGKYFAKVVRETVGDDAIIKEMLKHTSSINDNDIIPVMTAFVDAIKVILQNGNAVSIGDLGIFYLACPGSYNTPTPTPGEIGEMVVKFKCNKNLHLAVKSTTVAAVVQSDTSPVIDSELDMQSMDTGFTAGSQFTLEGSYLKVAGAASDNCGLYLVPENADGTYDSNETKWKRIDDDKIYVNKTSKLMARCPVVTSGDAYYMAVRTKAPSGGQLQYMTDPNDPTKAIVDPACLLKTPRFGISSFSYVVN